MKWPVDINLYPISQLFGENPDMYKKFGLKGHDGLDIACPTGTPVIAPHDGTVIEASFDAFGYGNYVKIQNDKEGSTLAHLQSITVKVGFQVKEGDVIGISNNTGNSTGSHLHWGYFRIPRDRLNGYDGYTDQKPMMDTLLPVGPTAQVYSKEQYDTCMADRQKFWKERDAAIKEKEIVEKELVDLKSVYTGFTSLGYNTVEDVSKIIKNKDDALLAQQIELKQVLDRNTKLMDMLKEKDTEDATAIELGIKAIKEVEDLKKQLSDLIKSTGAKAGLDFTGILNHIEKLKVMAKKFLDQVKKETEKAEEATTAKEEDKTNEVQSSGNIIDRFLKIIGLA